MNARRTASASAAAVFAALLLITVRPGLADAVPEDIPFSRPPELQQPIAPTLLAHLEATQRALVLARALLTPPPEPANFYNRGTPHRLEREFTVFFGGYVARAADDLNGAFAAVAEANAYVRAHPESNSLATGPVPTDEPRVPPLPRLRTTQIVNASEFERAADVLDAALGTLVNLPARGGNGPILGDIGGRRVKIIAAIARVGADLSSAVAYNQVKCGGDTGIIPLSAPVDLAADPKYGPTARTYLEVMLPLLDDLKKNVARSNNGFAGDQTQGGYVPKVTQDLQSATKDVNAALAYLDTHPEAVAFQAGPAGPEPSPTRRAPIPGGALRDAPGGARMPTLDATTVQELNDTLGWLLNNPAPDYRGPTLGDLGGYRGKIMDDLGRALADTRSGIDYTAGIGMAESTPRSP